MKSWKATQVCGWILVALGIIGAILCLLGMVSAINGSDFCWGEIDGLGVIIECIIYGFLAICCVIVVIIGFVMGLLSQRNGRNKM